MNKPKHDTTAFCRDEDCPSCGYPETYTEVSHHGDDRWIGCRSCLWRVQWLGGRSFATIVPKLTRAQLAAYRYLRDNEMTFIAKHGRYAVSDTGVSVGRRTLVNLVRRGIVETFTTEQGALGYRYLPPRERVNL